MILTDAERAKFADYLEMDAQSSEAILRQMEKLPGMEALAKKTKIEIAANRLVAKRLRNTTTETY